MSSSGSSTGNGGANGACLPASGAPVEGAPEGSAGVPLLDLTVLHELEEELGGTGVAHGFVRDYVSIWDKRIGYLTRSIEDNDAELAMDAVLSLKNSAFMVGGSRLACLAAEMERCIRSADLSAVQRLLPIVTKTGEDTVSGLKLGYLRPEQ